MLPLSRRRALAKIIGVTMNVSDNGLKLIAEFEGFAATPYNDPVGHCTVGYGELLHLGNCTPAELAMPPMTAAEGRRRLAVKVKPYAECVERCSRELNQNEFDALVSLCYNIGQGGYMNSAVRAAVNANLDPCPALKQIVKGTNGVTYPGLVRRRAAECLLFHKPVAVVEEDDMPAERVWDGSRTWIVSRDGTRASLIEFPAMDKPLEAIYGPHTKAMTPAQLEAIKVK